MKAILPKALIQSARQKRALNQWPSEKELEIVSAQLRQISQIGISAEAGGDYFMSGDLAYQLQEIVRTTSELLKKSLKKSLSRNGQ